MKSFVLLSLVVAPLSHAASAQAPVNSPSLGGNAVPGVCMLSRPAVFANAKVGVAATARLQQLAQQAQAEVDLSRKPLEADRKAFQAEAPKLTVAQRQDREKALETRILAMQQTTALRSREIEVTREKALARIATEMQPVVQQQYKAKGCGLLVDRGSVLGGNMANDLTPAVVQGLDARIATISFDRETLPNTAPATQR